MPSVSESVAKIEINSVGWKVAILLVGFIAAGFVFWFGGGGSVAALTSQTAATLARVTAEQDTHEADIKALTSAINTLTDSVDIQNQRLVDDEQRLKLRQ